MSTLSRHDAAQLWIAAMDHSQAVLAVDAASRKAALTEDPDDEAVALTCQQSLEAATRNLQAHIGQHVKEDA